MTGVVLYGAYGYTGRLICQELLHSGIRPLLAGRNKDSLARMAAESDLKFEVVELSDTAALHQILSGALLVIHAAGPFSTTAAPMIQACIATKTHYIDITGEWHVFEYAKKFSEPARRSGIMVLPGAGFDVVPSDCMAAYLSQQLPDASSLKLAFTNKDSKPSRGTLKTMIEGASEGHLYRENHVIRKKRLGESVRVIDFGEFEQRCAGISWGDISTAYTSTGIPDIEVFVGVREKQIKQMRRLNKISILLKWKWIQHLLKKKIDKRPAGPDENQRKQGRSWLWGSVTNGENTLTARVTTPDGYTLTSRTVSLITKKIIEGVLIPGYQTPATAYGFKLIKEVKGVQSSF